MHEREKGERKRDDSMEREERRENLSGRREESLLRSKVNKHSKFFIKTLIAIEYIESYIQNLEAPRTNDLVI